MADVQRWLTSTIGLVAALGTAQACTLFDDPNHCANNGNQCTAAQVCDPCTPTSQSAGGCVSDAAALDVDPLEPGCQLGGDVTSTATTLGEESTISTTDPPVTTTIDLDTTATDEGTDTTSTTGPPVDCMSVSDCMDVPGEPFCHPEDMECVSCSDMPEPDVACTDADDTHPYCLDGACVACTMSEQCSGDPSMPVCDDVVHECVICTEHDQCSPEACNLFTGACVAGPVVTVGPSGQEYTTLTAAVAFISMGGGGTVVVHAGTYNEPVTIGSMDIVAFLANGADRPNWQRTMDSGAPQLRVTGGATALMDGLDVRSNSSISDPALRVDGPSFLWVDRGIIVQNAGDGVLVEDGAELMLRNSFLANGNGSIEINVVDSTIDVSYTTIAANFGASGGIVCTLLSTATMRNSIVVSRSANPEVMCDPLAVTYTGSEMMITGMGNMPVGDLVEGWFTSYNGGNLHLTMEGETTFMGIAEWNVGDPRVDIDLEPRVGVDGMPEHAGADLP
jgi:hypothetical protein